ncbi:MAG: GldG family protein [Polyangiales bacterium]
MERRSQARLESGAFVFIVLAVAVTLNALAAKVLHVRADLTKRELYSLSQGTRRTLGRLEDHLKITVYWTPDQPAPAGDDARLLREQLDEYVAAARGKVDLEWVRVTDAATKERAEGASCREGVLQVVKDQQMQAVRVFRCLSFNYLRSSEHMDFVPINVEGLEYQVTSIVKKMIDPERPIGFLTGHGEVSPETDMPFLSRYLERERLRYTTRPVDLHGGDDDIPADIKGLVIMNPTRRIEERELRRINGYLMRGGSVAIFAPGVNVTGTTSSPTGAAAEHNLGALLSGYGVTLRDKLILDAQATPAMIEVNGEGLPIPRMFSYPLLAEAGLNQAHPMTFRLPLFVTPYASPMDVDRSRYCEAPDEAAARACGNRPRLAIIGRTSNLSVLQDATADLNPISIFERRNQIFSRGQRGPFLVAAALEGELRSAFTGAAPAGDGGAATTATPVPDHASREHPARLLLVSSGKPFVREQLQEFASFQMENREDAPVNLKVLFGVFDWISADSDLLAVRAKRVAPPAITATSETFKKVFQWGAILGLPALAGILGWFLTGLRARRRAEIKL